MQQLKAFGRRTAARPEVIAALAALALAPVPAQAYIGPGLGAGAIGAVLGVLSAVVLGLFAIIYYPIKRVMRKRRKARTGAGKATGAE